MILESGAACFSNKKIKLGHTVDFSNLILFGR